MDYYTEIGKTPHYEEEHERDFPWSEVVETLLRTKRMRKKGDKLELEEDNCYILCEVVDNTLMVINAKRKR